MAKSAIFFSRVGRLIPRIRAAWLFTPRARRSAASTFPFSIRATASASLPSCASWFAPAAGNFHDPLTDILLHGGSGMRKTCDRVHLCPPRA